MVGNGLDHEIRPVADVSVRAKKDRADADGDEGGLRLRDQGRNLIRACGPKQRAEETQIRRCIVQRARQRPAAPEEKSRRGILAQQRVGVLTEPVQRGNHGRKNPDKQDCHFVDGMKIEVVRFVNLF